MKSVFAKGWRPAAALLLLFLIWEAAVKIMETPAWLLPSPSQIFLTGIQEWTRFYPHLLATVKLSAAGFFIGAAIGLFTAVILHLLPFVKESVYPILILSQNIPIIVLAPLLIIWFGFGILPKIIVITLVCFFPVTIAALDGFRQASPELKQYMYMAGASKTQLFWKLEFPYSPAVCFFRIENFCHVQHYGCGYIRMARGPIWNRRVYDACLFFLSNGSCICSHFLDYDAQLNSLFYY